MSTARTARAKRLIRRAIAGRRDELVIATKCGIHYEGSEMVTDGRPERLRAECEESLRRLGTDRVELLYLHAPDENVPIEESAGALRELMEAGKTRSVGASNCTLEQLERSKPSARSPPCNCRTTCCSATSSSERFPGAANRASP